MSGIVITYWPRYNYKELHHTVVCSAVVAVIWADISQNISDIWTQQDEPSALRPALTISPHVARDGGHVSEDLEGGG